MVVADDFLICGEGEAKVLCGDFQLSFLEGELDVVGCLVGAHCNALHGVQEKLTVN